MALRVGIIGAGMIAHGSHAEAFQKEADVQVVAVADVDEARAKQFAGKFSIPQVYSSYDDLLKSADVEAVSVALPVFLHAPATVAALKAGKHVLCEKPMARNLQEAEAMVAAARESGRKFQVYWRNRFSPDALKARSIVESGELGEVHYVRAIGLRWRGRPGFDARMASFGKWFGRKEHAGGGTLMDIGGYAIDLVMGVLGFPGIKSVSGVSYQGIDRERAQQEGYDVEDFAVGLVRFQNGGAFSLETSWASNVDEPGGVWIFGSKAGLKLDPLTLYRDQDGKKVAEPVDLSDVKSLSPVHQFVTAIRDNRPIALSSGEQALEVQRIQDGLYRSAAEGREIRF